jgi:excisionase family DNA binding protein
LLRQQITNSMMEITYNNLPEAISKLFCEVAEIKNLLSNYKTNHPEPDEILTIEGAASLIHLTVATLRKYVRNKEIPFIRKRKLLYFSRLALIDWAKKGSIITKHEAEEKLQNASNYLNKK